MIHLLLQTIVRVVDSVPLLKGYRTVIVMAALATTAILDALGVGPGGLFDLASPILYPVAIATALAHTPKAPKL